MTTEKQVALNVRILRAGPHLSQAQVAKRAGICQAYIGKIENGKGNMTIKVLEQLARALAVTPARLITAIELHEKQVP